MHVAPSFLTPQPSALELARRLAVILAAIGAVVARRFLRDPQFHTMIVPLWTWLGRAGRRFERAVLRPVVMGPPVAPVVRVRAKQVRAAGGVRRGSQYPPFAQRQDAGQGGAGDGFCYRPSVWRIPVKSHCRESAVYL